MLPSAKQYLFGLLLRVEWKKNIRKLSALIRGVIAYAVIAKAVLKGSGRG